MSQKWLAVILILIAIPVILALLASKYLIPQKSLTPNLLPASPNPRLASEVLPIYTESDISGWILEQSILPKSPDSSALTLGNSQNQVGQAYWQALAIWKVFGDNGLVGINNTSDTAAVKTAAQPGNSAALKQLGVTAKSIVIKLTDKPQPLLASKNEKGVVVNSVGDQYDVSNQKLTILIHISPSLLEDPKNAKYLSPRATILYLARLFQLTHPDATAIESQQQAVIFLQDQLSNQTLLTLKKQ